MVGGLILTVACIELINAISCFWSTSCSTDLGWRFWL